MIAYLPNLIISYITFFKRLIVVFLDSLSILNVKLGNQNFQRVMQLLLIALACDV